ncbi:MAG: hypothetical protein IT285_03540 [Bdellovibrionales bacterium]|nr:hypothetical protein [Bdellovibrionales bacterium]
MKPRTRRIVVAAYAVTFVVLVSLPWWSAELSGRWQTEPGGVSAEEARVLEGFVAAARRGGLAELEAEVARFAAGAGSGSGDLHPDLQLYFVPARLEPDSTEREFYQRELKPAQDALRELIPTGASEETTAAFTRMRSRVLNYELGAGGEERGLSAGARAFLSSHRAAMGE